MRNTFNSIIILILAAILSQAAYGQDKKEDKWDVNAPFGPTKEVSFTTDEGTWMTVDVHPNGHPGF
ncbi:MAG: hypothetical protein KTR29_01900 [Rhodothermaceae bacterium]|nr:hypothetical protein [Rhodothermaceae bacterium]